MSNRLFHALRQLHPGRNHPAPGAQQPLAQPASQALEQACALDAQTRWPTHRIRSFLSMQDHARPRR